MLDSEVPTYRRLAPDVIAKLGEQFRTATPFPHLLLDGLLPVLRDQVDEQFPGTEWTGWSRFQDSYQHRKMFCNDITLIPRPLAQLIQELSSSRFLGFLEHITGIERLIPDPHLEGGGLHCSGPGGILAPHTDFHLYRRLGLYRRLNLIVYLNHEWTERDGGCLELYEKGVSVPARIIVPRWGASVVFRTDDDSVHGFTKPIVEGRWRRSIALYYYTSTEADRFSGDADTHWRTHRAVSGLSALRLRVYSTLMFASKCLSRVAHRVNPHFGSRLVPRPGSSPEPGGH
jgi:Rps23 Pro-64 3,4-dihydroxylase Tpa1-like proline 4-hydroxylase